MYPILSTVCTLFTAECSCAHKRIINGLRPTPTSEKRFVPKTTHTGVLAIIEISRL